MLLWDINELCGKYALNTCAALGKSLDPDPTGALRFFLPHLFCIWCGCSLEIAKDPLIHVSSVLCDCLVHLLMQITILIDFMFVALNYFLNIVQFTFSFLEFYEYLYESHINVAVKMLKMCSLCPLMALKKPYMLPLLYLLFNRFCKNVQSILKLLVKRNNLMKLRQLGSRCWTD